MDDLYEDIEGYDTQKLGLKTPKTKYITIQCKDISPIAGYVSNMSVSLPSLHTQFLQDLYKSCKQLFVFFHAKTGDETIEENSYW